MKLLSYWENKSDSDNPIQTNYGLHTQSKILRQGPGSEGVRGSFNTGGGDDLKEDDLYMPGGGIGG